MKFTIAREKLLKPLQTVQGVVERRHSLPILGNVVLSASAGQLSVLASDTELELVSIVDLDAEDDGEITVPARKLLEICRSLPEEAAIDFVVDGEKALLKSGRSRFSLVTLPASEFPQAEEPEEEVRVALSQSDLKRLVDRTSFAMAHQDVRYYLNGLLFEISENGVRTVATDGHRLALARVTAETGYSGQERQVILPRKGVTELTKLLSSDDAVDLAIGKNSVRLQLGAVKFTSKLIEGRFPDYGRVIPDVEQCDKQVFVDRESLKQALSRAAILSNDKYKAVRFVLDNNVIRVSANNPEQEVAEDAVEVEYDGEGLEIGFNVTYMIDALNALPADNARLCMTDANSSCLILPAENDDYRFVVMPMRL